MNTNIGPSFGDWLESLDASLSGEFFDPKPETDEYGMEDL